MASHLRALWRVLCLSICVLALPAAWAGQVKYTGLYVFGDSLSDTGNDFLATSSQGLTPAIPPSVSPYATYWQGRFSNGPVAAEYLWRLIGRKNHAELAPSLSDPTLQTKAALSFAFGGSTSGVSNVMPNGPEVPGLLGQVDMFKTALAGRRAPNQALYMVWSGANDYLLNVTDGPATVVGHVAMAMRGLYALGARDFLVPNLANMGATPFAIGQGRGAQLTQASKAHNALLKATLATLERELRQSRIVTVDVYKIGEALSSTGLVSDDVPALELLAKDTGAADCLFRNPATCVDVTHPPFMPPFLYWDVMHPTTQAHGLLGTAMMLELLKQR